jgi:hypothetical protein
VRKSRRGGGAGARKIKLWWEISVQRSRQPLKVTRARARSRRIPSRVPRWVMTPRRSKSATGKPIESWGWARRTREGRTTPPKRLESRPRVVMSRLIAKITPFPTKVTKAKAHSGALLPKEWRPPCPRAVTSLEGTPTPFLSCVNECFWTNKGIQMPHLSWQSPASLSLQICGPNRRSFPHDWQNLTICSTVEQPDGRAGSCFWGLRFARA